MELSEGPPGAEGYHDSVTELPLKKPGVEEKSSTKAEQEFFEHLHSLKIKVEDGSIRCMVERRGRDVSGKWIYLCFPCAAVCSGENILQTHLSGKKHKSKLGMKSVWPMSIFEEHPYVKSEKENKSTVTEQTNIKMALVAEHQNKSPTELDLKYDSRRNIRCHLQDTLDNFKAPLLGLEYLIEYPPEKERYEPTYLCVLCMKQGAPRTILNHLTCFAHRMNYLCQHFGKAMSILSPFRLQRQHRQGFNIMIDRLARRIDMKYGRLKPVNFEKEEYERKKDEIHQWICNGFHISDKCGDTFESVIDVGLLKSLQFDEDQDNQTKRDPSPPKVAAPKSHFKPFTRPPGRQERRSAGSLSDVSDEEPLRPHTRDNARDRDRNPPAKNNRYQPYDRNQARNKNNGPEKKDKPPNYEYKMQMARRRVAIETEASEQMLAYHEKNPEKHPLYPDEWKKFWNKRYKEIQAEGKDPSKHDFKPEWIVFWTSRMKEIHNEDLRLQISEIYRKLRLTPPADKEDRRKTPDRRRDDRRPLENRRSSLERPPRESRPPPERRRSPPRRRSPEIRRRSPDPRRRSPDLRRRSPPPRHDKIGGGDNLRSGSRQIRTRSRSPHSINTSSPRRGRRSPHRPVISLESIRRSRSPLSLRENLRNRSPAPRPLADPVLVSDVSDDELKPDEGPAAWNSDAESLGSLPEARSPVARSRSRTGSIASSRRPRYHGNAAEPGDLGPAENVVATLRLLVALEDYLGSLGPKIIDLLTEALKMEKESANSSEELLERESAVALMETAKEKLKGAVQAGLVPAGAAPAVRAAVVRAAATLHEADTRARRRHQSQQKSDAAQQAAPMSIAGVGTVDRAQIAAQMAAALVQQGRGDVTAAELNTLVDAVVGMAEAKKREAAEQAEQARRREVAALQANSHQSKQTTSNSAASALQMLQSAYDENDKKVDKDEAPEAMDRLSDSDLETLLKNFSELSAEEQHSLIAYLKKLEAREPLRVERLRQYVSAAVPAPAAGPAPADQPSEVTVIPSDDDDDYTVEDVFKSATAKVKEDQIRQEMEIVKKSLETQPTKAESPTTIPGIVEARQPAARNQSSATDLFALMQASVKSTSAAPPAPAAPAVVAAAAQPRSFGDPDHPAPELAAPPPANQNQPHWDRTNWENKPRDNQTDWNSQGSQWDANQTQPWDGQNQQNWDNRGQNWDNGGQNFDNQAQEYNNPGQSFETQAPNFENPAQNYGDQDQTWNNEEQNFNNPNQNWNNQDSQNWGGKQAGQGQNWNNKQVPVWDNNQRGGWNQNQNNRGQQRGNNRGNNRGRGNFANGNFDNRQNRGRGGRGNFRGRGGRGGF